jgi:hypothetical protein
MIRASRRALCSAGLSLAILIAQSATSAQPAPLAQPTKLAQLPPPGVSNEMRAEYLFRSGEKKFDSGQYAEACADFAESLRLGPKLGTLLNLALCHETVGKPATAWSEYHHGAAWAAQNGQKDRHDFAMQHVLALETKLPRVLLQLPADRALESVDVDGEPLPDSHWYLPVFLDPGEHSVTISAPGKQRGTVKFRVTSSPTEQLVNVPGLTDDVALAPPPIKPLGPADPDATRRTVGIVTMAIGAAGIAVGVTFAVLAIEKRDDIGDRCSGIHCTSDGAQVYRDAQSRATIATVGSVIGVAAGAAGAWLFFTSQPARKDDPKSTKKTSLGIRGRTDGAELGLGGVF